MPDAATANLALPLMAAAQAQKHVTHNEALVGLDTLVQLAVLDKDVLAPPGSPAEGDRYLIAGASPTGAWTGWAGRVVRYQDGAWRSFVPRPGWLAFVADEADLYTYTGVGWTSFRSTLTALQNLARLGIGTTADAQNPFAAKLNKALWTALTTAEGGTGDLRYTLNKQAPGNTLSLLFQSGFSGRAELGLTGDDDLRLKVSADGGTWREALRIDRGTGGLDLAAAEASTAIAATVDLGGLAALKVALTGAGTVTSFGTGPNRVRLLRFTGAATLTHNAASLVLPGGANLVTAAGDTALAVSDAAGNWRVLDYARASGKPLAGPAAARGAGIQDLGRGVLTGTAAQGTTALGLGTGDSPTFASLTAAAPANLGTAAGSATRHLRLYQNANNNIYLDATLRRHTAGSDWTGTHFRLQRAVDATPMGFIDFGVDGVPGSFGLGFGTGSTTHVTIDQGGGVGIASLSVSSAATFAGTVRLAPYTVATLPSGVVGALVYVSNGRKPLEGAGAGTGVVACYSNGNWRRLSDDSAVAA
jgi:Protein of unknown function (DUF2793)